MPRTKLKGKNYVNYIDHRVVFSISRKKEKRNSINWEEQL